MPRQSPRIIDEPAPVELARLAPDVERRARNYVARGVSFSRREPS